MRSAAAVFSMMALSFSLFLSGCIAETVKKNPPRLSSVPGVGYVETGGGEVRYSTDGWGIVVALRRRRALSKARAICKTKPGDLSVQIDDEYTHNDVDPIYTGEELDVNIQQGIEQYRVAPYHHVVFLCKPVKKQAPTTEKKKP